MHCANPSVAHDSVARTVCASTEVYILTSEEIRSIKLDPGRDIATQEHHRARHPLADLSTIPRIASHGRSLSDLGDMPWARLIPAVREDQYGGDDASTERNLTDATVDHGLT
jgi:hypothetical protein